MEKKKVYALSFVIVIGLMALYLLVPPKGITGNVIFGDEDAVRTYETLAEDVTRSSIVEDIPEDAAVTVVFYRNDSDEWHWEGYTLRRDVMLPGVDVLFPDIRLMLPLSYTDGLNIENFCETIEQANSNGDLLFNTGLSRSELLWKFKGMVRNRNCIGL